MLRSHLQSYFKVIFFHHSDFFISLNSKVIQQYWIEYFRIEFGLLDANRQRVDRLDPNTSSIKLTDQGHKSKLKTHSKKQQQIVSEVTEFSFILLSQGSEVSKGFINGVVSLIIR